MPTIEFTSYNENTLKDSRPILASKVQPEWWKKMKINEIVRGDKQQTIRACPAMQDWLTMGYYLIAQQDIMVQIGMDSYDESGKNSFAWAYDDPKVGSSSHPDTQFGNAFIPEKMEGSPVKDAFKMRNPWNIKTPEGYSTFYLDPFLHQNNYFSVWPGIIDTDKFNLNMDNAQIIFYPKVNHSFIIKKGTPLVQVIPFRREEWSSSAQIKEPKTFIDNMSDYTSEYTGVKTNSVSLMVDYDNARTSSDAKGEDYDKDSPEVRKSVQAAINESNLLEGGDLGPYRKVGMHVPKIKLYPGKDNNLEIPPECPMHGKEESIPSAVDDAADVMSKYEVQMEINFGDEDGS